MATTDFVQYLVVSFTNLFLNFALKSKKGGRDAPTPLVILLEGCLCDSTDQSRL